jgi:hypothetical protein
VTSKPDPKRVPVGKSEVRVFEEVNLAARDPNLSFFRREHSIHVCFEAQPQPQISLYMAVSGQLLLDLLGVEQHVYSISVRYDT